MEDTSGFGPLSLEEGRLEVLVVTLEEEVVSCQLLLLVSSQVAQGVVLTLELSSELGEGSNYLSLYFESLLFGNSRAEGVLSKVSANSNTGRVDHSILISWESRAVKLGIVHVADVFISLSVAVIFIYYFIEERSEGVVRVVRTSVDTDARLSPLAAGIDGLLKCESILIFLVLQLFPDLGGQALAKQGFGTCGEVWQVCDFLGTLEVGAYKSASGVGISNLKQRVRDFVVEKKNVPGLRLGNPCVLLSLKY